MVISVLINMHHVVLEKNIKHQFDIYNLNEEITQTQKYSFSP